MNEYIPLRGEEDRESERLRKLIEIMSALPKLQTLTLCTTDPDEVSLHGRVYLSMPEEPLPLVRPDQCSVRLYPQPSVSSCAQAAGYLKANMDKIKEHFAGLETPQEWSPPAYRVVTLDKRDGYVRQVSKVKGGFNVVWNGTRYEWAS